MDTNLNEIFDLYLQHGKSGYIGEQISQIEHALQAANLAEKEGFERNVILAAFLHDIGHLLGEKLNKTQMISEGIKYGVEDHDKIGADYLRNLCVPEKICFLVEYHVLAKRYLTFKVGETFILLKAGSLIYINTNNRKLLFKDKDYHERLSEASKQTLKFQGGVFTEEEAKAFESHELFNEIVKMRQWDDLAKDTTLNLAANEAQYLNKYKSILNEIILENKSLI